MANSTTNRKPGFMLVDPRLRDPTPKNAATFLRWTKLHFRDMLSMPSDPQLGDMTKTLRFAALDDTSKYLYTCVVDDIGILKSQPYYDVDRRLNLERTRELGAEEEAVGYEKDDAMIFDIVDAKFAIFEEVDSDKLQGTKPIGSYQHFPLSYTSTPGSKPLAPPSILVSLNIRSSSPNHSANTPQLLQKLLVERLATATPAGLELFTSIYRWAGTEAQPENHPMIECEESGVWLVTLLIIADERASLKGEHVSEVVGKWVDEVNEKKELKVEFGVWGGELFMS
ncbi:Nn.00g057160.m01.CDS01 [Neocucurbitaria sp. VM-36]